LLIHLRRNYAELRRVRHCADSGMIAGRKGQLDGDGFTRQREAIENYAAQHGITVTHWFEEKGVCGENELDERPALQELIVALHSNGTRLVLIEKLDRLARKLTVQESISADMQKSGFELISVMEPDLCGDDPSRVLLASSWALSLNTTRR
jgi:DNA invertase Pin-like site-specific DNA recombinase